MLESHFSWSLTESRVLDPPRNVGFSLDGSLSVPRGVGRQSRLLLNDPTLDPSWGQNGATSAPVVLLDAVFSDFCPNS